MNQEDRIEESKTKRHSVEWNKQKLINFKKNYNKAVQDEEELFVYDGNEYYVGYAKYLIKYLEQKL